VQVQSSGWHPDCESSSQDGRPPTGYAANGNFWAQVLVLPFHSQVSANGMPP
jgi:hypothetical protein